MKQFITPLLLIGWLAGTAQAQTTFQVGLRGGANLARTTVDAAGNQLGFPFSYSTDKTALYAWQAGAVAEISFGKLALQPGLIFSQKGERFAKMLILDGIVRTTSQWTGTTRSNWLELPLNVVYTLHRDHGLQLIAGPYVALGVGGRQRGTFIPSSGPTIFVAPTNFDDRIRYGADTNNRRLDAGVNFGIGYRQGPVQVQASYELGLRNLHQDQDSQATDYTHAFAADAAYNRVAQLTGTYFFAL